MADQRRYPRVPVTRSVRIEIGSGAVVQARMVNISQEGVALRYEAPAEVGARLELNFSLIVRGRMVEYCVACVARYKHLSSHGDVIGLHSWSWSRLLESICATSSRIKRSM
ncbi:MAG: PilZ domain-containing protein [Thiohalobacteraceae bacterium]